MTLTPRIWSTFLEMVEGEEVTPGELAGAIGLSPLETEARLADARVRRLRRAGGRTLMTGLLSRPDLDSRHWRGRSGFSMLDLF